MCWLPVSWKCHFCTSVSSLFLILPLKWLSFYSVNLESQLKTNYFVRAFLTVLHHIPSLISHNRLSRTTQSGPWLCAVFYGSLTVSKYVNLICPNWQRYTFSRAETASSVCHTNLSQYEGCRGKQLLRWPSSWMKLTFTTFEK